MTASLITVASSRFEAARHLDQRPKGHRCHGVHGHSFLASAFVGPPTTASTDTVVAEWKARVARTLEPLNYAHLNALVPSPTDENLARWIAGQIQPTAVDRVTIQSTPDQGVHVDLDGKVMVWRRFRFQAAHQLPHVASGHKCGRMHGHGFQVIIHAGKNPGRDGGGLTYDDIDAVWAPLSDRLNFRCLNDIPGLTNPTSELISSWLWQRIKPDMPELTSVAVLETESCGASFDGDSYRTWKDFTFDSAVRIKRAPSSRSESSLHGHTFKLRLQIKAPLDDIMGWTLDFGDVKAMFNPIFQALDHRPLHEMEGLIDSDTPSIAAWIHDATHIRLPHLESIELYETEGCGAIIATAFGHPLLPV